MIYHRKLEKFADTNVCGGASWWICIGAEVELDNSTEIWIWYSYVKMSQWLKALFSDGSWGIMLKFRTHTWWVGGKSFH